MLKLVKLTSDFQKQLTEMMEEWESAPDPEPTPWAIFKNDYRDFDHYLAHLEITEPEEGMVPDSTFFLYDENEDRFLGAVNIRHSLNDYLLAAGGHIGDGIRPGERRKGYATKMVALALEECRKLGIDRVLMVCEKENTGSAKSIQRNGGILENEITFEGEVLQRYWIPLS